MKVTGTISILINVVLLGGLTFLLVERRLAVAPPASVAAVVTAAIPAPVAEPVAPAKPVAFRWSQLDAKDYHWYVKNLRSIGCPEPTVRAIVMADVDSVYQIMANQMEQKLSAAENGSWSNQVAASISEPLLKAAIQRIPQEETAKIADLLGLEPAPAAATATVAEAPAAPIIEPLVLQGVDLSALKLDDDQQQMVASVRENFLQEVGDTNQAQSDPAFMARWRAAQNKADNMLMAMLGNEVYAKYEQMGYQASLAPK